MSDIGVGIIGGGYMGKAHAVAMSSVGAVFNTQLRPRLEMVAATTAESAERYRRAYGFQRGTDDWRKLVSDPKVGAVVIASPQATHCDIALAAFAERKHVMCEKPMGVSVAEAQEMTKAAEASGCANMVAYNYIRTPASQYARKLVAEGALGQLTSFRAEHTEDFLASPQAPYDWRCEGMANGTVGDLAPHLFNMAITFMGPMESLIADVQTIHRSRPGGDVTNDDQLAILCRFANGTQGQLFASRVHTGRKMGYIYEITGTQGAIRFDGEDQNALWLYRSKEAEASCGFTKILTGPAHPDYINFCLGPGHGTGYQDQIIIEARDFLEAIATGEPVWPTFREGFKVQQIIEAVIESSQTRSWHKL